MKTSHKFKVGDKVRFISKDSLNANYFNNGLDNLEIRELTKNEYDYQVYEQDKSISWGVNEEELELIPETYKYEVVHTETQEQWDFVLTKIKNTVNNTSKGFISYKEKSGLNIKSGSQADIPWWREAYKGNIKIYTFEEWLDKFGHKSEYLKQNQKEEQWIPQVGDYVITKGYSDSYDGRILKITKIDSNRYCYFEVFDKGYYDKNHNFGKESILRKAFPHEIPTQELSKEDLLAEAKRRFPIGTKFIDADFGDEVEVMKNDHTVVTKDKKIQSIIVHTTRGKKGKLTYNDVYKEGTWAEIVKEPKITEKSDNFLLPEKWYCKRTKENSKILNTWNNEKYDSYAFCEKGEGCMFSDKNYIGVDPTYYGEYKEITFEQFKKYVLNKSEVVKEKSWAEISIDMIKSTGNLPFKVTGYDEPVNKKLTNSKILPIKVRNSNITEPTELPKRTRIKIIKKQLLTI